MPDGQIFSTITNGNNTMGAYGPNIAVEDRWAIVAYVRALQKSQSMKLARPAGGEAEGTSIQAMSDHSHELTPPAAETFDLKHAGGSAEDPAHRRRHWHRWSASSACCSWLARAIRLFLAVCALLTSSPSASARCFWTCLHHATDAEWSVVVRRQLENVAKLLPYSALFFLPSALLRNRTCGSGGTWRRAWIRCSTAKRAISNHWLLLRPRWCVYFVMLWWIVAFALEALHRPG